MVTTMAIKVITTKLVTFDDLGEGSDDYSGDCSSSHGGGSNHHDDCDGLNEIF